MGKRAGAPSPMAPSRRAGPQARRAGITAIGEGPVTPRARRSPRRGTRPCPSCRSESDECGADSRPRSPSLAKRGKADRDHPARAFFRSVARARRMCGRPGPCWLEPGTWKSAMRRERNASSRRRVGHETRNCASLIRDGRAMRHMTRAPATAPGVPRRRTRKAGCPLAAGTRPGISANAGMSRRRPGGRARKEVADQAARGFHRRPTATTNPGPGPAARRSRAQGPLAPTGSPRDSPAHGRRRDHHGLRPPEGREVEIRGCPRRPGVQPLKRPVESPAGSRSRCR